MKTRADLRLSLGPVLFYWPKEVLLDFYARMVELPLDVIYLGETVCAKRRSMSRQDWLGLARDIAGVGKAEVVLSGMALIEAASELSSLRRLCENGEFMVEANDMAAVRFLAGQGLPFVAGPALNLYSGASLAELLACGMTRWVPPVECPGAMVAGALAELDAARLARPEVEVFAHGYLPLAYSARCFTARLANRPKDDCGFRCIEYPAGVPVDSQEGERLFTLNGIQTMSGRIGDLLGDLDDIAAKGADIVRISPGLDAEKVIDAFDRVRRGAVATPVAEECNGYWHGRPGMEWVPGAGTRGIGAGPQGITGHDARGEADGLA